jgi:hypothetical protein
MCVWPYLLLLRTQDLQGRSYQTSTFTQTLRKARQIVSRLTYQAPSYGSSSCPDNGIPASTCASDLSDSMTELRHLKIWGGIRRRTMLHYSLFNQYAWPILSVFELRVACVNNHAIGQFFAAHQATLSLIRLERLLLVIGTLNHSRCIALRPTSVVLRWRCVSSVKKTWTLLSMCFFLISPTSWAPASDY